MIEDPVVEEVHRTRKELLERFHGLAGVARYLKEIELELKERVVSRDPRPPVRQRKIS
jgi:hypothetical protein